LVFVFVLILGLREAYLLPMCFETSLPGKIFGFFFPPILGDFFFFFFGAEFVSIFFSVLSWRRPSLL